MKQYGISFILTEELIDKPASLLDSFSDNITDIM